MPAPVMSRGMARQQTGKASMAERLRGKVALVTGGASAIGTRIVEEAAPGSGTGLQGPRSAA